MRKSSGLWLTPSPSHQRGIKLGNHLGILLPLGRPTSPPLPGPRGEMSTSPTTSGAPPSARPTTTGATPPSAPSSASPKTTGATTTPTHPTTRPTTPTAATPVDAEDQSWSTDPRGGPAPTGERLTGRTPDPTGTPALTAIETGRLHLAVANHVGHTAYGANGNPKDLVNELHAAINQCASSLKKEKTKNHSNRFPFASAWIRHALRRHQPQDGHGASRQYMRQHGRVEVDEADDGGFSLRRLALEANTAESQQPHHTSLEMGTEERLI